MLTSASARFQRSTSMQEEGEAPKGPPTIHHPPSTIHLLLPCSTAPKKERGGRRDVRLIAQRILDRRWIELMSGWKKWITFVSLCPSQWHRKGGRRRRREKGKKKSFFFLLLLLLSSFQDHHLERKTVFPLLFPSPPFLAVSLHKAFFLQRPVLRLYLLFIFFLSTPLCLNILIQCWFLVYILIEESST